MENGLTWHTVSCLLLGANEPGGEGEKEEEEEEIKKENKEEKKEEEKEALIVLYIDPALSQGKEYSRTIPSPWGTLQILIVIVMWPHPIPQES